MKKILISASFSESLIIFRGPLLGEMVKKGYHVTACAPAGTSKIKNTLNTMEIAYKNIPLERTGLNPTKDFQTIFSLFILFQNLKPDVILSYTIKPVVYGSIAAKLAGVPKIYSIVTGLGYAFMGSGIKSRIINLLAKLLYHVSLKFNQKVFFQNPDDLHLFQSSNLITENQGVLINGSGVDTEYYKPEPFPENLSFLLIARLLKDKGIREYVEAARIIKQKYLKISFRFVGWVENNPASVSKNELDTWVKQGIIEYLGKVSDVRPAIATSSVYVLPSYREGTPRTVLEAMAMGRPIITTDAPGCRETVQHGKNGFLVPIKNVSVLVSAMEKFIRQPELIETMGLASRQIAVEKYDVRKVNAVILKTMGLD
ncbi:glycosyltransferase family 4 protein [Desulfococcaceae bacterium HSG9]|nr:glycosyltransferase family 4 protein [Desulfococcaceae bacterium HSG9]